MLENVKEGDLVIFKDSEERRIDCIGRGYETITFGFNKPVDCQTTGGITSSFWTYKYDGKWDGDIQDRNDIVKVIHIEEG